eukprot:3022929-Pleurochrysis_carterae.AAC.1
MASLHRTESEHKVKHIPNDGERGHTIRVRTCRLVVENELITEPYKPTQDSRVMRNVSRAGESHKV